MDCCETGRTLPKWHILEKSDGKWHVYSRGLRAYGGFNSVQDALNYILTNHSHTRFPICVQDVLGRVVNEYQFEPTLVLSGGT